MKKIIALSTLLLVLVSCGTNEEIINNNEVVEVENTNFIVGGKENSYLNVYGNIINNNLKVLTSNINGKVTALSCEEGEKVTKNTVVARISPDTNSLSYKNNLVQINSLKGQLSNLRQIRSSTILSFDTKYRQLGLQENELENQINNANNTIGNNSEGLKNQLKIIEESIVLLEKNRINSMKNIDDGVLNIRSSVFNTLESGLKRLDETFGITEKNKDTNEAFDDYLGSKNVTNKKKVKDLIALLIAEVNNQDEKLSLYSDKELSSKLDYIINIFKLSADVVDNSISSVGSLNQSTIDGLYKEYIGLSNGLISLKNNFDTLVNSKETTKLTFDSQKKQLEQAQGQLLTQESGLNSNVVTLNNNGENIKEQYNDLENTKSSSLKGIDSNILSLQQAINQLGITFREDVIYADTVGTVKSKDVSRNNNVGIGAPICTIVPYDNSLKLEVYSPNNLNLGMEFKYFSDGNYTGTGSIISESPTRNSITQNYTYKGDIDFTNFKEGDYIDIKVITNISNEEMWIPLNYVFPKLDGYYVNLKNVDKTDIVKVEVGKMNNGEILIKSGIDFGDTLKQ